MADVSPDLPSNLTRDAARSRASLLNRRSVGWLGVLVIGLGVFLFGASGEGPPETNADRAYGLSNRYACPVCQGQSVAESDVPIARTIRAEVRRRVDDGQTDDEITAYLTGRFGDDIDLNPSASGVTGLIWILPVVAAVGAVAALAMVFRRWQQVPVAQASAADRDLVERSRRSATDDPGGGTG